MKKIKILNRGFPTTHYGYLAAGSEKEVSDGFADYCVNKMKAAVIVDAPQKRTTKKKAATKKDD